MAGVDLELKKAFADLQTKMVTTKSLLKNHDSQIYLITKEVNSAKLTGEALSELSPETRAFESVGRMFVRRDIGKIQTNLHSQVEEFKEKVQKLEANKEYLTKNLKESEDNLRELVAQKQKARA